MKDVTVKGVAIGDKFLNGKRSAKVIDLIACKSLVNGDIVGYQCIAESWVGQQRLTFEVPFATVVRNRIS